MIINNLKTKAMKQFRVFSVVVVLCISFSINAQSLFISGSNNHSVVVCDNGNVLAWGMNDRGQVGLNSASNPYPSTSYNTPQELYGLPEIFQVDAGSGGHTLASTCDGKIVAWGDNYCGQLGNNQSGGCTFSGTYEDTRTGTSLYSAAPVYVQNVGGGGQISGVKYVSGGNDESYAIMSD